MRATNAFLLILAASLGFSSCKKSTETLDIEPVEAYALMQPGKFITYILDSTVAVNFGTQLEVHSYQEKHLVDAQITDGLGRPSYRVFRYLRDVAGTEAWRPAGSYLVTAANKTIEVNEDNLRMVKLATPLQTGAFWKGNRFLGDQPYSGKHEFENDDEMWDWDYTVIGMHESATYNGKSFDSVISISAVDKISNFPPASPSVYGHQDYLVERYAKRLGLIFQEYILLEYQPPTTTGGNPDYNGFAVKRTILDHN